MKSKRSRLALVGVLALALTVVVGLASGGVADAKKGKKKKGAAKSITVSKTTPTLIPPSIAPSPAPPGPATTPGARSLVQIPLTVGKKAKGKVVSLDSLQVSYTLTGSPRMPGPPEVAAAASRLDLSVTAPNGRTVGVGNPGSFDDNATTIGPVNVTPDSPFFGCDFDDSGTTTVCDPSSIQDPEAVVKPPTWAGTVGDNGLAFFGGVPAKGTWIVKVRNFSTVTTGTVSSVALTIGLSSPNPA